MCAMGRTNEIFMCRIEKITFIPIQLNWNMCALVNVSISFARIPDQKTSNPFTKLRQQKTDAIAFTYQIFAFTTQRLAIIKR